MAKSSLLKKFVEAAETEFLDPALVLLRDKRAFKQNWPELRPRLEEAIRHLRKDPARNAVGVQPASLGCVVLDCDEGDGPDAAAEMVRERFGNVVVGVTRSTSGRADRGHVWLRCTAPDTVGNWKFRLEDESGLYTVDGDLRSSGGQVRLTDDALRKLTAALATISDIEEAPVAAFQQMRTSSATEVDTDFDRTDGRDVSDDDIALLANRLDGPNGAGSRFEHLFKIIADLKCSGVSFDAALDLLSDHAPHWLDEHGNDDGKFAGDELERHIGMAWSKVPRHVSAEDDFDDDLEPTDETPQREHRGNPLDAIIDDMNQTYCGVLDGGQFHVFMEDYDEAFGRQVWTRLSREAFRNFLQDEKVPVPDVDKRRHPSKADFWLDHPKRRKYPGIVMDPQRLPRNGGKLNLWRGWSVEPSPGDWSLMEELIGDVLCDGDSEAEGYVRRWIAHMLQRPWETPEAAIAFRGNEGTGKGTLGRALMRIAGPHGLTVSSRAQFAGRFNSHLRNCVFLFADEAVWPGDKEGEGIIKQLVTEPVISYEAKGKDITAGRNMVHMMLASNEEWIVPAGKDARRFFVSDVSDRRRGDHAFFGRLWRQMEDGGFAAMMHDLLAMDLDGWRPSSCIPQTRALGDQKVQSLDPPSKFFLWLLSEGNLAEIVLSEGELQDWQEGPIELGQEERTHMLAAYDAFLKRNRIMHVRATHKALVNAGKPIGLSTSRPGGQERCWTVPSLAEMRANFEERLGAEGLFEDA